MAWFVRHKNFLKIQYYTFSSHSEILYSLDGPSENFLKNHEYGLEGPSEQLFFKNL